MPSKSPRRRPRPAAARRGPSRTAGSSSTTTMRRPSSVIGGTADGGAGASARRVRPALRSRTPCRARATESPPAARSISPASRWTIASPRPSPLRWWACSAVALRLVELFPDLRQVGLGDADAAVPDLQQQPVAAAAGADQHAAVVGVADRVADQVAQHPFEQHRVGMRRCRRGTSASGPFEGRRLEVQSQLANSSRQEDRRGDDIDTPVSMRVMSSSSAKRPSSASTEPLMLATSDAASPSCVRWRSASANRPIACSGWRRSWLAAAKNCVLARLAASAARPRGLGGGLLHPQLPLSSLGPRDFSRIACPSRPAAGRCAPSAPSRRTGWRRSPPASCCPAGSWSLAKCARRRLNQHRGDERQEDARPASPATAPS